MVSVSDSFDFIASSAIVASILVGVAQVGSGLGSISDMVSNALGNPQQFGVGLGLFFVGLDTWTPAIPKAFLDQYGLGFLTIFYWYAGGDFIPHYSMWSLIFSLIFTVIAVWLTIRLTDWDFWFEGLLLSFGFFFFLWWLWGLIAWNLMYLGANLMGMTSQQAYQVWHASVTATQGTILQWFFLALVPISAVWISKKIAGAIV